MVVSPFLAGKIGNSFRSTLIHQMLSFFASIELKKKKKTHHLKNHIDHRSKLPVAFLGTPAAGYCKYILFTGCVPRYTPHRNIYPTFLGTLAPTFVGIYPLQDVYPGRSLTEHFQVHLPQHL